MQKPFVLSEALFRHLVKMMATRPLRALLTLNEYNVSTLMQTILTARARATLSEELLRDPAVAKILHQTQLSDLSSTEQVRVVRFLGDEQAGVPAPEQQRTFSVEFAEKRRERVFRPQKRLQKRTRRKLNRQRVRTPYSKIYLQHALASGATR